jgi:SSS family solute:Na+ symporter
LIQLLVVAVIGAAYCVALMRPALMVYIILMAYAVTAQFLPATMLGLWKPGRVPARAVIAGLVAGFVTALIFVFRLIEPPYNIHAGILGLAVNVPVLLLAARVSPGVRKNAVLAK